MIDNGKILLLSSQFSSSDESEQSRSPLEEYLSIFLLKYHNKKDIYSQTNVRLIQKVLVLHRNKSADSQVKGICDVGGVFVILAKWLSIKSWKIKRNKFAIKIKY